MDDSIVENLATLSTLPDGLAHSLKKPTMKDFDDLSIGCSRLPGTDVGDDYHSRNVA